MESKSKTVMEKEFFLLPETEEIYLGKKTLNVRYSEYTEKLSFDVFGIYRNLGEEKHRTFYKSFGTLKTAKKCFEGLIPAEIKEVD